MRPLLLPLSLLALLLVGCEPPKPAPIKKPAPTEHAAHEGHDHSDHDHEDDHAEHVHVAPRGGLLLEVGDHQANVELVHDPKVGRLSIYALDAHAENPVRLSVPAIEVLVVTADSSETLQLLPVASALTGETATSSSHYAAEHPKLIALTGFEGQITAVSIAGAEAKDLRFRLQGGGKK